MSLQKNIKNEQLKLNQCRATNEKYRREIDTLRKELTSSSNEVKKLSKNISKSKKEVVETNKQKIIGNKISEDTTTQIIALKAKHE